jgi:hypothetical protein
VRVHGVDFAFDDLACARHSECCNLFAQVIASTLHLQIHLLLCRLDDACAFSLRIALGHIDDLIRLRVRLLLDLLCPCARLTHQIFDARFGIGQFLLAAFPGGETIGNLLLSLTDRTGEHRHHYLGDKPKHDQKYDDLPDKRGIDIHGRLAPHHEAVIRTSVATPNLSALGEQRIGGREKQRQTHTDQERRVDQSDQQQHSGLQYGHQLWLATRGLEKLGTHHTDPNAGTGGTQTDHEPDTDCGMGLDESNCVHSVLDLLVKIK